MLYYHTAEDCRAAYELNHIDTSNEKLSTWVQNAYKAAKAGQTQVTISNVNFSDTTTTSCIKELKKLGYNIVEENTSNNTLVFSWDV